MPGCPCVAAAGDCTLLTEPVILTSTFVQAQRFPARCHMLPRLLVVVFGLFSGCLLCFLGDPGSNRQWSVQDGELCVSYGLGLTCQVLLTCCLWNFCFSSSPLLLVDLLAAIRACIVRACEPKPFCIATGTVAPAVQQIGSKRELLCNPYSNHSRTIEGDGRHEAVNRPQSLFLPLNPDSNP